MKLFGRGKDEEKPPQAPVYGKPTPLARGRTRPRGVRTTRKAKWNRSRLLFGIGAFGLAAMMALAFVLPSVTSLFRLPVNITGPGTVVKQMGKAREHVPDGTVVTYTTVPPTSGPHYSAPAIEGFYGPETAVPDERSTHNLEHSQVVISYNFKDPVLLDQLRRLLTERDNYPCYVVARYYEKIPANTIALTAWTRLDGPFDIASTTELTADIKQRINAFLDAYAGINGLAPEWFPCTPQPIATRTPKAVTTLTAVTSTPFPGTVTPSSQTPTTPVTPTAVAVTPTAGTPQLTLTP